MYIWRSLIITMRQTALVNIVAGNGVQKPHFHLIPINKTNSVEQWNIIQSPNLLCNIPLKSLIEMPHSPCYYYACCMKMIGDSLPLPPLILKLRGLYTLIYFQPCPLCGYLALNCHKKVSRACRPKQS
jgi:hypothetical protein